MNIKVLWFDDEFDSEALKSTFIRMEQHFKLIKCYTKDEFLDRIKNEEWDAIVLDVLDSNGRDSGFQTAVRQILSDYKDEPWFVFSGQENVISKESEIREVLSEAHCQREYADMLYIKSEHNDKLIDDIKSAVSKKSIWQLKKKYNNVLSAFDDNIQGKEQLFDILLMLHGHKHLDHQTYYTQLRRILEWIFRDANRRGLLHDKCINKKGKVNLTESSLFMAGENTNSLGVCCDISHFPKIITANVKNMLEITGGASHTVEPEKKELMNLQDYWDRVKTPYLLYSLTFTLCDILIWYKAYTNINSDITNNKLHWKNIVK